MSDNDSTDPLKSLNQTPSTTSKQADTSNKQQDEKKEAGSNNMTNKDNTKKTEKKRTKSGSKKNARNNRNTSGRNTKQSLLDWQSFSYYFLGTSEGLRRWACESESMSLILFISLLRGYAQVFFMDNAVSGLIICICLTYNNIFNGIFSLIGGITNLLTAMVLLGNSYLRVKKANYMNNGIFAYNGCLIGLMVGTFNATLNVHSVCGFFL